MLTISTFNIQNDIGQYNKKKTLIIKDYLLDNNIDILNLQELYSSCEKDLLPLLAKNNYTINGKYRYKLKLFNRGNEKTPIITNRKVVFNETYHLPFIPSFLKRIVTKVVIDYSPSKQITIFNTHLDFQYDFVKERQLKKLLSLIKKEENPIIITGDFNLKNNKQIFIDFIKDLESLNIYRVKLNEKTLKHSQYNRAIDHIFLSKDFKIISKEVIKNLSISDHYPLLIKVKL